jgi:hypothetical protein
VRHQRHPFFISHCYLFVRHTTFSPYFKIKKDGRAARLFWHVMPLLLSPSPFLRLLRRLLRKAGSDDEEEAGSGKPQIAQGKDAEVGKMLEELNDDGEDQADQPE